MVSVASLLNPEPPRAPLPSSRPSQLSLQSTRPPAAFTSGPSSDRPTSRASNMTDHHRSVRHTARGMVNYPPFEDLDATSLREVQRFQVSNLRLIQSNCRRIPYHSQKKDFYQKTGRESFEVFEYSFKLPRDSRLRSEHSYIVMWDYNIGLVRMTPFFKCLEYGKTTPAKMLNQNPGLKDITHSITGGSIIAQGYWMPYSCAKAVCATFCHQIAGALIPLFGPGFPSECIPEGMPGYKHMVIDPEIIAKARIEARRSLHLPTPRGGPLLSPRLSRSVSPRPCLQPARLAEPYSNRIEYDRPMLLSPHSNADQEFYAAGYPDNYGRTIAFDLPAKRYGAGAQPLPMTTLGTSSRWTAVNLPRPYPPYRSDPFSGGEQHRQQNHQHQYQHQHEQRWRGNDIERSPKQSGANPWLSAVPRLPSPYLERDIRSPPIQGTALRAFERPLPTLPPIRSLYHSLGGNKRTFDQIQRPTNSHSTAAFEKRPDSSPYPQSRNFTPTARSISPSVESARPALEEDAAMTLMKLSGKPDKQEEHQELDHEDRNGAAGPRQRSSRTPDHKSSAPPSGLTTSVGSPASSQTRVGSEAAGWKTEKGSALSSPVVGVAPTPASLATSSPSSPEVEDEDDDDYNEDQSPKCRSRSKRRRILD
ncbi:hypothetical protein QBC40DRAFT_342096 [Triangularia verruculosa]|uniref:HTH APSES-type domain-containing protein n=1 Tax=Triangularia verruculosa TaxID=2587418 RepID=A0AAN6XD87_9PEZI|nr:hypothetical protein QBC40DRAFT_342096 [Triangularia verruculosa]